MTGRKWGRLTGKCSASSAPPQRWSKSKASSTATCWLRSKPMPSFQDQADIDQRSLAALKWSGQAPSRQGRNNKSAPSTACTSFEAYEFRRRPAFDGTSDVSLLRQRQRVVVHEEGIHFV